MKSLGATFLEFEFEAQKGEGGYAHEQGEEFLTRQREMLAERVAAADVVITTAAVPGRRAPLLVTAPMVKGMRRGSVIVDLAAEIRLVYPLDGPWYVTLPALRIASIVSSIVNNLVVLIALTCPGVTAAMLVARAALSSGASVSATTSYSPKQK